MSIDKSEPASLSLVKQALLAVEQMQAKLEAAERKQREPIAIVGIGCRFPGQADSPDAFWQLLAHGVNAVTRIPAARWDVDAFYDPNPDAPGKAYTQYGAFLDDIDRFDAQFGFGFDGGAIACFEGLAIQLNFSPHDLQPGFAALL